MSSIFYFILFANDAILISKYDISNVTLINSELSKVSMWLKLNKLLILVEQGLWCPTRPDLK